MEKAVQALLIVWISPMEQMGWFRKELYPLGGEAIYYRSPWGVCLQQLSPSQIPFSGSCPMWTLLVLFLKN